MKKYLFLLIVPIILFFPKEVFAQQLPTGITFYDENYNVLDKCTNCTELYNIVDGYFEPYYNVFRVRYTYEDIGLYKNLKYNFKAKVLLNYCLGRPVTYVGLCYNGNCPTLDYQWTRIGLDVDVPTPSAEAVTYQFDGNWTQSENANEFFLEIYFDRPMDMFLGASLESVLTATGDSGSDIIANVGQNIIDNQNKNQQQTNERLDGIKDYLESDDEPSSDISSLGNVQGLLPPGPVDSLLNIPFKFLSIIVSSLGELCVPLSFNWVFNKTLTLPCFTDSFYNNVPDYLMLFINLIPSGFILINYLKYLYKKVNRAVSLETNADDEWGVL